MYKHIAVAVVGMTVVVGCAARRPVAPDINASTQQPVQKAQSIYDERYRLWGEWTFFIDETHERIDMVPRRQGRFHFNVLKWLEEDCADCLEILYIQNNGDSTIDMAVRIRHPKPDQPELTGFDVKGILMFKGSHELPMYPLFEYKPDPIFVSWREAGDPEVLNPDGYTERWSPSYDSGSDLPLLKYWPGKYSSGTPNAYLNAFLNFYTYEERHMFAVNRNVTRIYHIYLPPGLVIAGYAVEACWAPPDVIPVTDPLNDFPPSANQPELYHFRIAVNNNEPITTYGCCGFDWDDPCKDLYLEFLQWDELVEHTICKVYIPPGNGPGGFAPAGGVPHWELFPCTVSNSEWYSLWCFDYSGYHPNGLYRAHAIFFINEGLFNKKEVAWTIYDFTVDIPD